MTNRFSSDDARYMELALRLARRGQGDVEPNPMVGAVVVRDRAARRAPPTEVVGKGFHRRFGDKHAEVNALAEAGARARGATLYVTLEPCCHWGKTPPCTDAILAAGIERVVVAMVDPFAKVRGRGVRLLRRRGVRVEVGLLEPAARALNAPYITRLAQRRPYIIAKWAQSIDGCVATASGESKWISSEVSRELVQQLRGRMDAIIVGLGTVLADDPLLMARPARARSIHRIATRIVLDSHCRLPLTSQLVGTIPFAPVMLVHALKLDRSAERRRRALAGRGVMTVPSAVDAAGRPSIGVLLRYLAAQEYTNVLVEGGPEVMASFVRKKLVDEAHVFVGPMLMGGAHARRALGGPELKRLADAAQFELVEASFSGTDAHLHFRCAAV